MDEAVEENLAFVHGEDDDGNPLPPDDSQFNWLALSRWANGRFGLNTNDRELKKIGRDGVAEHLKTRAREAVERSELGRPVSEAPEQAVVNGRRSSVAALRQVLRDEYPRRSLSHWLSHQFGLHVDPGEFADLDNPDEVKDDVMGRLDRMYKDKEVMFPVAVGMTRFLQETGSGDRLGLARWASGPVRPAARPRGRREQAAERVGGPAGGRLPRVLHQRRGRRPRRRHPRPGLRRPRREPDAAAATTPTAPARPSGPRNSAS